MKKLLMGATVLFLFAASICLVQISCKKADAQARPVSTTQLNKIIFFKNWGSDTQIWTADYDGSNAVQILLTLPPNIEIQRAMPLSCLSISPDGQTIFFSAFDTSVPTSNSSIYSCDITGSNVREVIPAATNEEVPSAVQAY